MFFVSLVAGWCFFFGTSASFCCKVVLLYVRKTREMINKLTICNVPFLLATCYIHHQSIYFIHGQFCVFIFYLHSKNYLVVEYGRQTVILWAELRSTESKIVDQLNESRFKGFLLSEKIKLELLFWERIGRLDPTFKKMSWLLDNRSWEVILDGYMWKLCKGLSASMTREPGLWSNYTSLVRL